MNARGIAKAMKAMDCRAVGIASQDLAGGIDALKNIQAEQQLTLLSANLADKTTGQPIFSPFIETRIGSTNIAVLGITDEQALGLVTGNASILPWHDVLPDLLAGISKEADMIILLSSYPETINKKIAQALPTIDMILESSHAPSNQPPRQVDNTLLAKTGSRGKYLGMMRINWTESGHWGQNFSEKIRAEQNHLDRINWQIGRLKRRSRGKNLAENKNYNKLLSAQQQSKQKIADLKKANARKKGHPCSYSNQFVALKSFLPKDNKIQAIINQTTRAINTLNQEHLRHSHKTSSSALSTLTGGEKCRQCHPRQYNFWQSTDHTHAWQTLAGGNAQFNEDCLLCHVTLPYYDSARVRAEQLLVRLPDSLKNVGCESCHGPGADHARQPKTVQMRRADEKTCKGCHTPEHDDNFIFSDKNKKIRCPKG
ncbi:MAG: hypothetical protein DSY80_10045 [Desulfocapsa sp.]|nr:MAG: hypothetical protein DSY80_10045 [Desulfocapsa sp.]